MSFYFIFYFLTDVFTFLHGFLSLPALNYFSTYLEIGYKIKLNILTSVSFFINLINMYIYVSIQIIYLHVKQAKNTLISLCFWNSLVFFLY